MVANFANVAVKGGLKNGFRRMARSVAEPNGFWKSLALGLSGIVVLMLGWFLVDQAYQDRQFRQQSRADWRMVERRLNRIETQLDLQQWDTE